LQAGIPVNNQSVLLRGVNDSLETMRDLMRALLRIKVRPYYLFHCDPVIGAGHFRTSVWKGLEIMEGLRGHLSGLGIPTYVVDSPHGGGKIPLMPTYLISASDDAVVLRNFEGMLVRYQAEDKLNTVSPTRTGGVSALLQGTRSVLIPSDNERMARRRQQTHTELRDENTDEPRTNGHHTYGHGKGCSGTDDHGRELIPLGVRHYGHSTHPEELVTVPGP
jgi:lysine 2,3-aminomutase